MIQGVHAWENILDEDEGKEKKKEACLPASNRPKAGGPMPCWTEITHTKTKKMCDKTESA